MAFIDYYKVMGIPKDHPQNKMKEAHRKRSKQFHPDLHPDDPKAKAKFQLLNEAFDCLGDPKRRKLYDTYGERWKDMEKMGVDPDNPNGGAYGPFGGNPYGNMGGGNPFVNMGGGMDFDIGDILGGMFGRGQRQKARKPKPEPTETQVSVTIDVWTFLLGGEIVANTPYGNFKLKIAPGTQPGKKVRLKGKGGTTSTGMAKDLIVQYDIQMPTTLTERQKELLQEARNADK